MKPAVYFGAIFDKRTGKLRRIFNPNHDVEFAAHHVDDEIEWLQLHRKEDWGVPLEPDSMTLEMVWRIHHELERRSNRAPGE